VKSGAFVVRAQRKPHEKEFSWALEKRGERDWDKRRGVGLGEKISDKITTK